MTDFQKNDARLIFDEASHTYTLGDRVLPSVTSIMQDAGLCDFSAPWFTESVRTRGQLVHAAIALDIEGDLDDETLDPVLEGYVAGWRQFLIETGAAVEHSERRVCDPVLGFAGTLDSIVRMQDANGRTRRTLLDFKPATYPSVGPQTAAYAMCADALYPEPVFFARAALILPGNGTYKLEPLVDPLDKPTFLAALRVFQFRQRHNLSRKQAA